jgi:DNA polymerase-1
MLLTVHDEIVFDLFTAETERAVPLIKEAMQEAWPLDVPIEVEVGIGKNWLEAH